MQALLSQLLQASHGMTAHQQLEHFIKDTRRRHIVDQWCHHGNRRACGRRNLEIEFRSKAHHAQKTNRVFTVACLRVTDHAQRAAANIFHATVIIEHHLLLRIVIHRIDREITPFGIFMLLAEGVVAQNPAMLVFGRAIG